MRSSLNYQVPDLADSIPLISEPPDIKNWFSSYTYESPQLNTYEYCKDRAVRAGDDVEEAVDDGEKGKEEEQESKLDETTINRDKSIPCIVDSSRSSKCTNTDQDCDHTKSTEGSESLSLPSEPPDIRNWFSSYAYESLRLDMHENFEDSERGKKEEDKKKLEGTATDKHKLVPDEVDSNKSTKYTNSAQYRDHTKANEVLGSLSDSLPFSPEPPHVNRWFSSYVYESPSLDTSIDFTDFESPGTKFVGARCYAEKSCVGKGNNLGNLRSASEKNILTSAKKVILNGLATCSNFVKDNNSQLQCTDTAIDAAKKNRLYYSDLPNEKSCGHPLKVKQSTKDRDLHLSHVRKRDSVGEDFISGDPLNNPSSVKGEKSLEILSQKNGLSQGPAGTDDKENKGNNFQENGFVSTKKKRNEIRSGASSLRRSSDVPLVVNKENFQKRKPFSERSNLQHNYDGLEITGKWKCPQKRKPNLGPPLKQLRLEQWVNRI